MNRYFLLVIFVIRNDGASNSSFSLFLYSQGYIYFILAITIPDYANQILPFMQENHFMRERDFYTNPIDSFSRVPNSGHFQHFGWSIGHLGSQTISSCLVRRTSTHWSYLYFVKLVN